MKLLHILSTFTQKCIKVSFHEVASNRLMLSSDTEIPLFLFDGISINRPLDCIHPQKHVFLHERSCFPSRAVVFSLSSVHKYKKVYTFLNFRVHLSGFCCTPFHRKVYTFLNYRPHDLTFTSAREGKLDRS